MQTIRRVFEHIVFPPECPFSVSGPSLSVRPLPVLPHEIWLEIFEFATYMHRSHHLPPLDPFVLRRPSNNVMGPNTPFLAQRTKATLVLVCRLWHHIATPLLYEHIVIPSPPRAAVVLRALESHTSVSAVSRVSVYGLCVRHLEIFTHARNTHSVTYLQTLFHIFLLCPRLRILSGTWKHPLPREFMRSVIRLYGSSLQELYWQDNKDQSFMTTAHLASFHTLRVLDLRNYSGNHIPPLTTATLPLLQHIILASTHESMSAALSLSLPSLTTLTIKPCDIGFLASKDIFARFITLHGASVRSVHLPSSSGTEPERSIWPLPGSSSQQNVRPDIFLQPDACPRLHTLTFSVQCPAITLDTPHTALRRIGVRDLSAHGLYPDKESTTKAHLMAIKRDTFPSLETVRTVGFLVESDTDKLVEEVFIWWTEHFESEGVDFQDGAGVVWVYEDPVPPVEK